MQSNQRGIGLASVVWSVAGILAVVALCVHFYEAFRAKSFRFNTPYQAVLLTNGAVYFGRLENYGTPHPVLTDVYYVVSQADPNTKQISHSLIKRGKELHEPDRMYLNPNQVVFVESVGPNSKVAQLIAEQKKQ